MFVCDELCVDGMPSEYFVLYMKFYHKTLEAMFKRAALGEG